MLALEDLVIDVLAGLIGFIVAAGAVAAAVGLLAKSPLVGKPLRWLWRRNISEPVGEWNRQIIADVVDVRIEHLMHNRNGGSSLLDLAEAVSVIRGHVEMLLEHDAERDVRGRRYGKDPDHQQEEP